MSRVALAGAACLSLSLAAAGAGRAQSMPAVAVPPAATAFVPRDESAIPDDELGRQIRLGKTIFTDTARAAPGFVGNDLKCSNCHLDAGRRADASPLWGAYGMFPQFRAKNGHVNTFAERLRECFMYSMNGRAPAYGGPELTALESYAAFLARGAPIGVRLPGQGYPKLDKPGQAPDRERGKAVFTANCALCHGDDGAGRKAGDEVLFPPLWGPRSYNWGAGMARINNAAAFIKANMPQNQPGLLTLQQAWDVAAYIDGKPRPQDPRYAGSAAETRRRFQNDPQSLYGLKVDGQVLGGDGPPRRR